MATLGKISWDKTLPDATKAFISGTDTPMALANTPMAGGNFSPSCCLSSSMDNLPLANICVYAMKTKPASCPLIPNALKDEVIPSNSSLTP